MTDLLGVLETPLYVDAFERACPFYEQVLGLNSIYRDARLCAYDVGGRGVLLLFLRGRSLETMHLPGGMGGAPCRRRRRRRGPDQMAARRREHLFPRSRRPSPGAGDAGIVAGVL